MTSLKTQAIQTALSGDWNSAITLNTQALKENPKDIETLNRLAFAYTILGKIKEAKATYTKVLNIDKQNPIAIKNLKRLNSDKASSFVNNQGVFTSRLDSLFLEESGKTKVIDLVNIADPKVIAHLMTGEALLLRIKRLKIFVLDKNQKYVGVLPDNIGKRLLRFMKGGNSYEAYVKSADKNKVSIFIRETRRSTRFKNQPSFVVSEKSQLVLQKGSHKMKSELDDEDEEAYDKDESL